MQRLRSGTPIHSNISADRNLFSTCPSYGIWIYTFGLMAPDGTGLGYHALAPGNREMGSRGNIVLDGGTAYDGLYTAEGMASFFGTRPYGGGWPVPHTYFTAHDSFKGVLGQERLRRQKYCCARLNHSLPQLPQSVQPDDHNPVYAEFRIGDHADSLQCGRGKSRDILAEGRFSAGSHNVEWDASKYSSGVYFCQLSAGTYTETRKMTLVK